MLVVAPAVTQACNDKEQVVPMLAQQAELPATLGKPTELLTVSGYYSAANASACTANGTEPLMAVKRKEHHPSPCARFTEPPPQAAGTTPAPPRRSTWGTSCKPRWVVRGMHYASKRSSRCSESSTRCWDFGNSRCVAWKRSAANGLWCAWHGI